MNLLLFLGAKLFGLGAFKLIFIILLVINIVYWLILMGVFDAPSLLLDVGIYAIYFMWII